MSGNGTFKTMAIKVFPFRRKEDENPPEVPTHEGQKVPDDANGTDFVTPSHTDSTKFVFISDIHEDFVVRRGPIQSRIFDKRIGVALRPQDLVLATPILQREVEHLTMDPYGEFADYRLYSLGDGLNVSNEREYALLQNADQSDITLIDVMDDNGVADLASVDDWLGLYQKTLQKYAGSMPPTLEGNHDGAYVGNGLNHQIDPTDLRLRITVLKQRLRKSEHKLADLEESIAKTKSASKRSSLERSKKILLHKMEKDTALLEKYESELSRYLDARSEIGPDDVIPGWVSNLVLNSIFGVPRGRTLFNPEGYAAQNAGGAENIVDKKAFTQDYLASRYPELASDAAWEAFVTQLDLFDPETGNYRTDKSHFSNINDTQPENVAKNFNNFWTEIRPGEFVCLFAQPDRAHASSNQKYILLQAFDEGLDNAGRHVFHFLLDGMDATDQDIPIAFIGVLSEWQRRLCQLFIDHQRLNNPQGCIFLHSCHFPLRDISKKGWRTSGWMDYFAQKDIAPFVFAGHRHSRGIVDETKKITWWEDYLRINTPLGVRSMNRKQAYDFLNPSVIDNLEFMTAEMRERPGQERLDVVVRYHDIVPDDREFPPEVIAAVDALSDDYRQSRYREYSELKSDFFHDIVNVFFTNQERIVALDSIPISIGQYDETIRAAQASLAMAELDFGEYDADLATLSAEHERVVRNEFNALLKPLGLTTDDALRDNFLALIDSKQVSESDEAAILELWASWFAAREAAWQARYTGLLTQAIDGLIAHRDLWMNGDGSANNDADRIGYLKAKAAVGARPNEDGIESLVQYNDIFDTPYFDLLRHLIAQTPESKDAHRTYDFWLLLGKRASLEENGPGDKPERGAKKGIPDQVSLSFSMTE